jgi:hypothetical protein
MDTVFFKRCYFHHFHGNQGGRGAPQGAVDLPFKKFCPKMKLYFETERRKPFLS